MKHCHTAQNKAQKFTFQAQRLVYLKFLDNFDTSTDFEDEKPENLQKAVIQKIRYKVNALAEMSLVDEPTKKIILNLTAKLEKEKSQKAQEKLDELYHRLEVCDRTLGMIAVAKGVEQISEEGDQKLRQMLSDIINQTSYFAADLHAGKHAEETLRNLHDCANSANNIRHLVPYIDPYFHDEVVNIQHQAFTDPLTAIKGFARVDELRTLSAQRAAEKYLQDNLPNTP